MAIRNGIKMILISVVVANLGLLIQGCEKREPTEKELEIYHTHFNAFPPHPQSQAEHDMCYNNLLDYINKSKLLLFTIGRDGISLVKLRREIFFQFQTFAIHNKEVYIDVAANPVKPFLAISVVYNGYQNVKNALIVRAFPLGQERSIYISDEVLDVLNGPPERDFLTFSWSPDGEHLCFIERIGKGNIVRCRLNIWGWADEDYEEIAEFDLSIKNGWHLNYRPQWDSQGRFIYVVGNENHILRVNISTGDVNTICPGQAVLIFDDDTLIVVRKSVFSSEETEIFKSWGPLAPYVFIEHKISTGAEKQIIRTASYQVYLPLLSPSKRYICFTTIYRPSLIKPIMNSVGSCVFDLSTHQWCKIKKEIYDWIEPNEAWLEALKKLPETSENNE